MGFLSFYARETYQKLFVDKSENSGLKPREFLIDNTMLPHNVANI